MYRIYGFCLSDLLLYRLSNFFSNVFFLCSFSSLVFLFSSSLLLSFNFNLSYGTQNEKKTHINRHTQITNQTNERRRIIWNEHQIAYLDILLAHIIVVMSVCKSAYIRIKCDLLYMKHFLKDGVWWRRNTTNSFNEFQFSTQYAYTLRFLLEFIIFICRSESRK